MVKLYLRDNTTGRVFEYGQSPHDALYVTEDGTLHYENMANSCGTSFQDEGYTFVLPNGIDPREDEESIKHGCGPYIDIGGMLDMRKYERKMRRFTTRLLKATRKCKGDK